MLAHGCEPHGVDEADRNPPSAREALRHEIGGGDDVLSHLLTLVEPENIVGIYSDPGHVFAYDDGEVRQQFSVCFACRIVGGELQISEESSDVAFFSPEEIEGLDMHESIRLRIQHYLERRPRSVIA